MLTASNRSFTEFFSDFRVLVRSGTSTKRIEGF